MSWHRNVGKISDRKYFKDIDHYLMEKFRGIKNKI